MNQEKIGKLIAECRKNKKMTQQELAEKLGVSDRTVGNWENGRNMPDLSLFKPLCYELGISMNDLMSGEKITKEHYQEKLEENIINLTVNNKKLFNRKLIIFSFTLAFLLMIFIVAVYIYNFFELDVKYDGRLMKCSFNDNVLTYKIIGNSVLNTNYVERTINREKYMFFHSTINIYNKRHSNWEYGESLAKMVNDEQIPFGSEWTFDKEKDKTQKINVYYTNKSLKKIDKMTNEELKKELKNSFIMCSNEVQK